MDLGVKGPHLPVRGREQARATKHYLMNSFIRRLLVYMLFSRVGCRRTIDWFVAYMRHARQRSNRQCSLSLIFICEKFMQRLSPTFRLYLFPTSFFFFAVFLCLAIVLRILLLERGVNVTLRDENVGYIPRRARRASEVMGVCQRRKTNGGQCSVQRTHACRTWWRVSKGQIGMIGFTLIMPDHLAEGVLVELGPA